jgi:TM2 domain-containing membrane protein YozV
MSFTTHDMILIETRVANRRKSAGAAYLLWLFLGWLSAHRFYLGKPVTAIVQILSYFILVGFVWWLLDLFLIPGIIDQKSGEVREELTRAMHRRRRYGDA